MQQSSNWRSCHAVWRFEHIFDHLTYFDLESFGVQVLLVLRKKTHNFTLAKNGVTLHYIVFVCPCVWTRLWVFQVNQHEAKGDWFSFRTEKEVLKVLAAAHWSATKHVFLNGKERKSLSTVQAITRCNRTVLQDQVVAIEDKYMTQEMPSVVWNSTGAHVSRQQTTRAFKKKKRGVKSGFSSAERDRVAYR